MMMIMMVIGLATMVMVMVMVELGLGPTVMVNGAGQYPAARGAMGLVPTGWAATKVMLGMTVKCGVVMR